MKNLIISLIILSAALNAFGSQPVNNTRTISKASQSHRQPGQTKSKARQQNGFEPQQQGGCQWECSTVKLAVFGDTTSSPISSSWKMVQGCDDGFACERPPRTGVGTRECRPTPDNLPIVTACR